MTNKEIANTFLYLGDLMELHGENPFKIKSYRSAYLSLRKYPDPLSELPVDEISKIKGVGKAITAKIEELKTKGSLETIKKYEDKTPEGIRTLLRIKGVGPKKIAQLWKDLEVESIGELLYAIHENRLLDLKGFGAKTQEDLRQKLEYYLQTQHAHHYASGLLAAEALQANLTKIYPEGVQIKPVGDLAAQTTVLESLDFICDKALTKEDLETAGLENVFKEASLIKGDFRDFPVSIAIVQSAQFATESLRKTTPTSILERYPVQEVSSEEAYFEKHHLSFIPACLRSRDWAWDLASTANVGDLVEVSDIKGVIHSHSTYSDGVNTLEEMLQSAYEKGFEYMLITDHSKSAFYANGLSVERIYQQWEEIEQLNKKYPDIHLLKGIESDILSDGSLDYEDDVLAGFDLVIASVHSNLRMDEQKANERLLRAIENPYTHILGHPTGRLLLSRKGYPIDHKKIIDACAANGVSIELNANPWRLDLDPDWIKYAMDREVHICINPDAHSTSGIDDIRFGVLAAQHGGLRTDFCLNARSLEDFMAYWKK